MLVTEAGPVSPKAALVDIQGTLLHADGSPLPHAGDAIAALRAQGVAVRFVTNIDSVGVETILGRLTHAGISALASEVFSPISATVRFLELNARPRCFLLVPDTIEPEFAAFRGNGGRIDCVVVGDCREGFTYARLNEALRHVMAGAQLVALQKGRFFPTADGPVLDTGAFVSALEYGSGQQAHVIGKPSAELLRLAIADLGCDPFDAVMVGDDVASDVAGAHAIGARSVLVRTGKFTLADLEQAERKPDLVIDSIADLPAAMSELAT